MTITCEMCGKDAQAVPIDKVDPAKAARTSCWPRAVRELLHLVNCPTCGVYWRTVHENRAIGRERAPERQERRDPARMVALGASEAQGNRPPLGARRRF